MTVLTGKWDGTELLIPVQEFLIVRQTGYTLEYVREMEPKDVSAMLMMSIAAEKIEAGRGF